MKFGFSRQIFEKISNNLFHQSLSSGSRVVPRGQMERRIDLQTDGHDKANSRFSQFGNAPTKNHRGKVIPQFNSGEFFRIFCFV